MTKQYIAHSEHAVDDKACTDDAVEFKGFAKTFAERRYGKANAKGQKSHTTWKSKKRRRLKAFSAIMQLRNMIRVSTKIDLDAWAVEPDKDGKLSDHWHWPILSLSPDCGADMVCMLAFLMYFCNMNVVANWDPAHMFIQSWNG